MNKWTIGNIAIIFGSLLLSLQIYGLVIIQCLDKGSGSWNTYPSAYAGETPVSVALCITGAVIIYGVVIAIQGKTEGIQQEPMEKVENDSRLNI